MVAKRKHSDRVLVVFLLSTAIHPNILPRVCSASLVHCIPHRSFSLLAFTLWTRLRIELIVAFHHFSGQVILRIGPFELKPCPVG